MCPDSFPGEPIGDDQAGMGGGKLHRVAPGLASAVLQHEYHVTWVGNLLEDTSGAIPSASETGSAIGTAVPFQRVLKEDPVASQMAKEGDWVISTRLTTVGSITRILARQEWVQKGTLRKLESAHSYICLWANSYNVLGGRFKERVRRFANVLSIITSVNHLSELTPVVAGLSTVPSQDATSLSLTAADLALTSERLAVLVQGDNDSDTSDDGEAGTSPESVSREKLLDGIADDLMSDTQCLLDLGPRFAEQVTNPIATEAATNPLSSFDGGLSDTFTERILRLYPHCESNLARRLGNANWRRVLKIVECEPRTSGGRVIGDQDDDTTHDAAENESVGFGSAVDTLFTWEQSLFHDSRVGTASHVSGAKHRIVNLLKGI
ncbi:hypothetical protein EKO27_g11933 [Xylaria grammica]|uniref:Uncharacterized protein n=1 Tax=Xylaria grammica TaxID=363999 RepID=A0A439CLZ2_9PEZI|nr:hypothetical protein EKO27_g11933 [Xylaria grammica]